MELYNLKIRKHSSLLLLALIIFSLFYISFQYLDNRKSITMKEAYYIANDAVLKKNSLALLVHLGSTDSNNNTEGNNAGKNGTRRYWNLIFAVPNTDEHWIVAIRDRKIVDIIKVMGIPMDEANLIDKTDFLIDSRQALKIAQNEYNLKPGEVWAIGYHFTISKESGNVILHVIARDQSNNFANISINADTKKITGAIHKVTIGGGIFDGSSYKDIVKNYDVEGMRIDHNSNLFAWGRKMLNIIQYQPIVLYKKSDEDLWNEIDFKDNIRNIEPAAEENIFIICDKSIYSYPIISKNSTTILETNEMIINSKVYNGKLYALTKSNLNLSADNGKTWSKIPLPEMKDITNISCDFDENQNFYISIHNKIYRLVYEKWEELLICEENINDFKFSRQSLLYTTDKAVKAYDLNLRKDFIINTYPNIMKLVSSGQDYFYAITNEGKLYKINEKSENNTWILTECYTNKNNGFITDVLQLDKDQWYYSAVAERKWVNFNKGD